MGFSKQEYWNGLPFLSPGVLPELGIELALPALEDEVLTMTAREVLRLFFKYYDVIVALNFTYSCKWLKFYKVLQSVKVDNLS